MTRSIQQTDRSSLDPSGSLISWRGSTPAPQTDTLFPTKTGNHVTTMEKWWICMGTRARPSGANSLTVGCDKLAFRSCNCSSQTAASLLSRTHDKLQNPSGGERKMTCKRRSLEAQIGVKRVLFWGGDCLIVWAVSALAQSFDCRGLLDIFDSSINDEDEQRRV